MTAVIINFPARPVVTSLLTIDPADAPIVTDRREEPYDRHVGDLYDADASPADCARTIRRLVKDAVKGGQLPAGLKCRVRTRTYAGGASIDVDVTALPDGVEVYSPEYIRDTLVGGGLSSGPWRHESLGALLADIEAIAKRVQRKTTQAQSDYCAANVLIFVDVCGDIRKAARVSAVA